MKIRFRFLFLVAILIGVSLISRTKVNAANCTLVGAVWTKQAAAVGENIQLHLRGNDCNGWTATFDIYEIDVSSITDDYIRTLPLVFQDDNNATITIQFTPDDYVKGGNESGNEQMYVIAVVGSGATKSEINNRSSYITLNAPTGSGGGCQLSSANWQTKFSAEPIVGSPLHMVVTGNGCPGDKVSYKIYDYTAVSFDGYVGQMQGQFNSAGTIADTVWKAQGKDITTGEDRPFGTYKFYFIAAAGTGSVQSPQFPVTVNSQNGCINCNNIGGNLPGTQMCADDFSGSGSGNTVCLSHIGDALTDASGTSGVGTGGTGGTCGGTGQPACKPGETKTFSFSIPNPLKGGASDLAGLVKVIAQWLFNLSIPIAVIMIIYAGVLFLTAQGNPTTITKAKDVLKYAVIGLAIILIGSGFVTLIQSILKLGSPPSGPSGPVLPGSGGPGSAAPALGSQPVGGKCSRDRDCFTSLKCQDSVCKRGEGNRTGEFCNSTRNCEPGLSCDKSDSGIQVIDGQTVGTCLDSGISGGRIGDLCEKDSNCISGLKCNKICQRKDGNLEGEACLKTASTSNCKSRACKTTGADIMGVCVEYSGT